MVYEEPDYDQLYEDMKSAMCDLEEKGAPGASMFFDKTIKISDKMQQIIATNGSIFEKMPIGPLYQCLPESLHCHLPDAFLHSYVIHNYYDKAKFDDLFKQNNEDLPSIIVMENSEKMYEDVITDPESVESTVKSLLLMDPTLANLLIDYFEVHTWSKTCLTAIDCFELDIAVHL